MATDPPRMIRFKTLEGIGNTPEPIHANQLDWRMADFLNKT